MPADKLQDCELLLPERATLHGKLEEHDKALHILVHQLKDSPAAEEYCSWASVNQDQAYRQNLFHQLLSVYLDPDVPGGPQTIAAVDLLNRHANVFDAVRVLDLLPEEWSLPLLRPFLCGALRSSVHAGCTSRVAVGLARAENLQLKHDRVSFTKFVFLNLNMLLFSREASQSSIILISRFMQLKYRGGPILVSEKKGCKLCHNTFSEPDCACLPGGTPVHIHCVTKKALVVPVERQQENAHHSNHT